MLTVGSLSIYKELILSQIRGIQEVFMTGVDGLYVGARVRFGEKPPTYEVASINTEQNSVGLRLLCRI